MARTRMTNQEMAILRRQINVVLREDHPQSVRHVFYRMTDPRLDYSVDKTDKGYVKIQNIVLNMRRSGQLPYSWIVDASRLGYRTNTYENGNDFVSQITHLYRSNMWEQKSTHVEVWVESRSIAGIVQSLCKEFAVTLYPAGGFSSATMIYEAAEEIKNIMEYNSTKNEIKIIYIGDYDPAGVLIDKHIHREMEEHLDRAVMCDRIAINEDQITLMGLPTKPRKDTDKRAPEVKESVEAEAMPASVMKSLLRNALEGYITPQEMKATKAAEESERAHIKEMADTFKRGP